MALIMAWYRRRLVMVKPAATGGMPLPVCRFPYLMDTGSAEATSGRSASTAALWVRAMLTWISPW